MKEDRLVLLEAWRDMEEDAVAVLQSSRERLEEVEKKFPKKVKMKRYVDSGATEGGDDGNGGIAEEYFDYVFPDDEKKIGECAVNDDCPSDCSDSPQRPFPCNHCLPATERLCSS